MLNINDSNELAAIVLIGEMRHGIPVWSLPFDPSYSYTDGQLRALYMRLQRIMTDPEFSMSRRYTLSSGEKIYITDRPVIDSSTIFTVILKEGNFDDKLINIIRDVANRGGVYTAKKFYSEIKILYTQEAEMKTISSVIIDSPDPISALDFLRECKLENEPIEQIATLLAIIGTSKELSSDICTFNATMQMLTRITKETDADVLLDSAFVIASRILENQDFSHSSILFDRIANLSVVFERLALEISCRVRNASISKLRGVDNGFEIIDILSPIDDGSLEAATQIDREEYYCLQGYAFYLLNDYLTSEDLYMMAIMISETATFPSMNKAEAHWFIGRRASENYSPEIATRELMTASSIANQNGNPEISILYSHLAAKQEIKWANMLSSAAVISRLENDLSSSEYQSWGALGRLLQAYSHADKVHRATDISDRRDEIISMTTSILSQINTDYVNVTIDEIIKQLDVIDSGELTRENEIELLKYLSSRVSAMIPLPTPVILLIANDGRLIIGGEVGAENWDNSVSTNDDLFSGALSAIMAIMTEVTSSESHLRMVDAGTTQIMIEKSSVCIGALLVDRDLNVIRQALITVVKFMETNYPELKHWDGYSLDFENVKPKVEEVFKAALLSVQNY
ncbi:MAG: hypothetical protein HeimC2_19180 [Candidatus Heimdallarchaeota archaeon LC_2]|nr:MAG: hypothetical protein HeimC2_19180 [Candidatus Heimdallarchaeota archaeon LC_2]